MFVDKVTVNATIGDDMVGDIVEDRKICTGLEDDRNVGKIGATIGKGREYSDLHLRMAEPAIGDARPRSPYRVRPRSAVSASSI